MESQFLILYGSDYVITLLTIIDRSYSLPTSVQAEAIPLILGGGDVLMVRVI